MIPQNNFLSSTLLFTAAMWWPLGSIATCCIEALGSGIIGSDWSFCNNQLMSPASDKSKVWPASSKCELLQTGRLQPSPAGWGGGRRRLLVRWLGRFAKERKVEISFSIHGRVHLAGEISHFEIPDSGCAVLSSCEHPPSFCLFIRNGISPVCVNNWQHLKSNRHHVFADALKVDNRREIARCEIEHPE